MARQSAKRPAAAATDAASDDKKQKQTVFSGSITVVAPEDVSPVTLVLDAVTESKRAARQAEDAATEVLHIKEPRGADSDAVRAASFELFATPFEAAVASACAKGGSVTLNEVITAMTKATGKVKIDKRLKLRFVRDGFKAGRWQISRLIPGKGQVPFPKGAPLDRQPLRWRFSPSPAARCPLADLSK